MRIAAAAFAIAFAASAEAGQPAGTPEAGALRELAPTGTLRAAINLGNPVLAREGTDGPAGVSVDLARRLAERLGVPVAFVTYPSAGAVTGSAGSGAWDVCFLAIDPKRAEGIAFTAPYVLISGSYLVPADSPIRTMEAVDREGVRVSVGRGSAYDLFLTRAIKHASLVRAPTSAEAVTLFARERLDVAANVHQLLVKYAAAHPEVRLIPGHFMEIPQAMGLAAGREAGAAYLSAFVAAAKADGFVAKSLEANGQDPALAAP
jgi:polar amino acid transport system substrate-binding protein